ncbi:MAG: ABC transporter substrate-binding protein [Bdellovibrio sp. CG10_big_fil_rev_8_21_14_0_10_47_8]|nr:MAG: ABC transporter substrate-binding protein [Bdellovibrio sp. CG10_big_fil_rev_8_21_14_0_10_47_8]
MKITFVFSILFVLILMTVQVQAAKTFVYCSEGSPSGFNPQLATDGPTFNASSHAIYNTLVEFKSGTTEVEAGLAESWSISKDGLTYIFKLRKGVQFHSNALFKPTRNFNADDVLFSFNRQRLSNHPYNKISGGNYEYFASMDMGKIIKDIVKKDDMTVEFHLSQREAPFLANMAMDFASIFSSEYADAMLKAKTPEKVDTDPIGTGPFVFKSYQKDTLIRYTANPDFFNGKPKIDKLVFSITPDASVRFQKLKVGECHLIAEPAPQDIDSMKSNNKIRVVETEGLNVGYLAFNTRRGPFVKKEVREALNMAFNRKAYLEAIYMNRAVLAQNPMPPTIWSYNEKIKGFDYNPEKAKQLLAKAGYPKGFETEMWTLPVSRPYNPSGKKMGEMMQADLAKIGVKVKLVSFDWPTYLEKSRKGEHQMIQMGWIGDNGDPDNFLNMLLSCNSVTSGSNLARWCNKKFSSLVEMAKQTSDIKKRTELYKKAQEIFKEEAPWATLAYARVFRAMSVDVVGYQLQPFGSELFEKVDLK